MPTKLDEPTVWAIVAEGDSYHAILFVTRSEEVAHDWAWMANNAIWEHHRERDALLSRKGRAKRAIQILKAARPPVWPNFAGVRRHWCPTRQWSGRWARHNTRFERADALARELEAAARTAHAAIDASFANATGIEDAPRLVRVDAVKTRFEE